MAMLINVDKVIHNLHNEIDNCTEETSPFPNTIRKLVQNTIDYLRKQPTVDAVEVVRCKDCKHREDEGACPMYHVEEIEWDDDGYMEVDYVPHDYTTDDGFCDRGERKDNDRKAD